MFLGVYSGMNFYYVWTIIVPGSSFDECNLRLGHVFQLLREANLKLKPSKCNFFLKSLKFVGHVVSEEVIHTDPDKTEAIRDWPIRMTARDFRSFLGYAPI